MRRNGPDLRGLTGVSLAPIVERRFVSVVCVKANSFRLTRNQIRIRLSRNCSAMIVIVWSQCVSARVVAISLKMRRLMLAWRFLEWMYDRRIDMTGRARWRSTVENCTPPPYSIEWKRILCESTTNSCTSIQTYMRQLPQLSCRWRKPLLSRRFCEMVWCIGSMMIRTVVLDTMASGCSSQRHITVNSSQLVSRSAKNGLISFVTWRKSERSKIITISERRSEKDALQRYIEWAQCRWIICSVWIRRR